MQILKAGGLYFAVVFGAGFVLGILRVLWIVPAFGTRTAELMEAPIMLVVVILAARWTARRLRLSTDPGTRLGVGVLALLLLMVAELTVVLGLRGLTVREYLAGRDAVAGTVYLLMLCVFALMPLMVARR